MQTHTRNPSIPPIEYETGASDVTRWASRLVWALPAWAFLLALSTITHQPDPKTEFTDYADYVTTTPFLVSHLAASIGGAALGAVGAAALAILLMQTPGARRAVAGMVAFLMSQPLVAAVFGVAAFFQPAVGDAFLAGEQTVTRTIDEAVYGSALYATVGVGMVLMLLGMVLLGQAANRSGVTPAWAGRTFAIAGVAFSILGFPLPIVQPVAALAVAVSAAALATRLGSASR